MHGRMYHLMGPVLPAEGAPRGFAQLWIYGSSYDATTVRFNNDESSLFFPALSSLQPLLAWPLLAWPALQTCLPLAACLPQAPSLALLSIHLTSSACSDLPHVQAAAARSAVFNGSLDGGVLSALQAMLEEDNPLVQTLQMAVENYDGTEEATVVIDTRGAHCCLHALPLCLPPHCSCQQLQCQVLCNNLKFAMLHRGPDGAPPRLRGYGPHAARPDKAGRAVWRKGVGGRR